MNGRGTETNWGCIARTGWKTTDAVAGSGGRGMPPETETRSVGVGGAERSARSHADRGAGACVPPGTARSTNTRALLKIERGHPTFSYSPTPAAASTRGSVLACTRDSLVWLCWLSASYVLLVPGGRSRRRVSILCNVPPPLEKEAPKAAESGMAGVHVHPGTGTRGWGLGAVHIFYLESTAALLR